MKYLPTAVVSFIALSISAGCASTSQFVPLPDQTKAINNPSMSRIYLLRPTILGSAITMRVDDGNKTIGQTGPRSYLCWEREPGAVKLVSHAENEAHLEVTTETGRVYYVQQHIRPGWITARSKLSILSDDKGKKLLGRCKPPSKLPTQ